MPSLPPELNPAQREDAKNPYAHLGQLANIAEFESLGLGEWITLYEYQDREDGIRSSYSGLLSPSQVNDALKQNYWDLDIDDGRPSFTQKTINRVSTTTYNRFGMKEIEPLVYIRDFNGLKPEQIDLNEEFRLFHNLYHDRQNDKYIHIDDRGSETIVAEINPARVRVLTRFLRQYMAAKQLALVLFFDHQVDSYLDFKTASAKLFPIQKNENDGCYSFGVGETNKKSFSRLLGKKIISAPSIDKCGVWPYEERQDNEYADFIISVDEDGKPIEYSCDHKKLSDYFGANEKSPNYLTPVWFTKDVLRKYYDQTEKFSVSDGYLKCGSLWGLRIDNNIPDYVVVYLGDLGRDLSYKEQLHWRLHNVTPSDRKPSQVNFTRSFLAEFSAPSEPDLIFKAKYNQLNEIWSKKFGWLIFRPFHNGDEHIFKQLRIPLSDDLSEFDNQILSLVKLTIDYLNEAELAKICGISSAEKGIKKLEEYLKKQGYPNVDRDIATLRCIQGLRSSGAAHAKGGNFDQICKRLGLNRDSSREVFRRLLTEVNQMLNDLSQYFLTE